MEVGKYYRHHNTGELIHVVTITNTDLYGRVFVAESNQTYLLKPIGSSTGWKEIDRTEWDKVTHSTDLSKELNGGNI